jgi:hypothetical protein
MKSDGTILINGKVINFDGSDGVGVKGGKAIEINSPKNHIGGETKLGRRRCICKLRIWELKLLPKRISGSAPKGLYLLLFRGPEKQ